MISKKVINTTYTIFLLSVLVVIFRTATHRYLIRKNSQYRYTIVEFIDRYHQGDVRGWNVRYSLNGVEYLDHCSDNDCFKCSKGNRFIIKVYLEDPEVFDIIYTIKALPNETAPEAGWEVLPRADK